MKNQYKYLITYIYNNNIGTVHLTTDKPIKSFKSVENITSLIRKKFDNDKIIIISHTLVRKSERRRKFIK